MWHTFLPINCWQVIVRGRQVLIAERHPSPDLYRWWGEADVEAARGECDGDAHWQKNAVHLLWVPVDQRTGNCCVTVGMLWLAEEAEEDWTFVLWYGRSLNVERNNILPILTSTSLHLTCGPSLLPPVRTRTPDGEPLPPHSASVVAFCKMIIKHLQWSCLEGSCLFPLIDFPLMIDVSDLSPPIFDIMCQNSLSGMIRCMWNTNTAGEKLVTCSCVRKYNWWYY